MGDKSAIEWTDATWNPVTGCTKITRGCDNCYAERFAERWRGISGHPYEQGFNLRQWPLRLDQPKRWRRPKMIFVNSMSDLFHKKVERRFIDCVFETMESADWHIYQILTKRSSLMRDYLKKRYANALAPQHIWCGVSVENISATVRITHLKAAPASIRFISAEPLLGSLGKINFEGISWVIVGGESGPQFRPMDSKWVHEIKEQCFQANVPFFFKQWGGARPKSGGRKLEGVEYNAMPEYPQIRDHNEVQLAS